MAHRGAATDLRIRMHFSMLSICSRLSNSCAALPIDHESMNLVLGVDNRLFHTEGCPEHTLSFPRHDKSSRLGYRLGDHVIDPKPYRRRPDLSSRAGRTGFRGSRSSPHYTCLQESVYRLFSVSHICRMANDASFRASASGSVFFTLCDTK